MTEPRWWNPSSVMRAVQERKTAGLCPTCEHAPHRDGPCETCGDRCHYLRTLDADLSRFADAQADFGMAMRDAIFAPIFRLRTWLGRNR